MRLRIVVQRYGSEILGGAERHAALIASLLSPHHDLEVWTTTAGDYQTWSPAYPEGFSTVDGLRVRRFAVDTGRTERWGELSGLLHEGFEPSSFARLPRLRREQFAGRVRRWPLPLQEAFIREQGPEAGGLMRALEEESYDRVLFFTYLYPTTYDGLERVDPARARVVPTLHDEPTAYLPAFGARLERARLLCSTASERALLTRLYPERTIDSKVIGYGIDLPEAEGADPGGAVPFLLYAGRVDSHKGRDELLDWYRALRATDPRAPRLILIGERDPELPALPGLKQLGFVDEARKIGLMRDALALVQPSPFESLGIVLLEAMALGTPLIVNACSPVMVEHCRRGRSGLWVRDGAEFASAVRRLQDSPHLTRALGTGGARYVEDFYSLDRYRGRLLEEFPPD